jgi:hypothetical protein
MIDIDSLFQLDAPSGRRPRETENRVAKLEHDREERQRLGYE